MTVLRLIPAGGRGISRALAVVDSAVLARVAGVAYVEVSPALVPRLTRALAFGGIAATPCAVDLAPPPGLHPARGIDLSPLPRDAVGLDVVQLRRIPLGPATREALRRPFARLVPPSAAARARCRALLRGENVVFAWARRTWAPRAVLRSAAVRATLRPVVFDRDAFSRAELLGRTSSSDDQLGRWLFA